MLERVMSVTVFLSVSLLSAIVPTALAATFTASPPARRPLPRGAVLLETEEEGYLDVVGKDGKSLRDHGARAWRQPYIIGHPDLGSMVVTSVPMHVEAPAAEPAALASDAVAGSSKIAAKEPLNSGYKVGDYIPPEEDPNFWDPKHYDKDWKKREAERQQSCGNLVKKVLDSIKWHLGQRKGNTFSSLPEAQTFANLEDAENGAEVLTNTFRVLGNYTLDEGIHAGTIWTIDNQNHFVSCEQNIKTRLDEHTKTEFGDTLVQGDMAVTTALCRYSEQSSKVAPTGFPLNTQNCIGVSSCQFSSPEEAVHFCNNQPECTVVQGLADEDGCWGGYGCYMPKQGAPIEDGNWSLSGGRTYIKHCPGALIETQNNIQQGLRDAGKRWKDGEISFCFASDVDDVTKEAFHIAVERIQEQVPCIHFNAADRVNDTHCSTVPSIMVRARKSGCWSYVGQISGREKGWERMSQPLNLDRGCGLVGVVMHELGHAMGMVHENSRADRINVMTHNDSAVKEKMNMQFQMTNDVVKYAWASYDGCVSRAGRTRVSMTKQDCMAVNGYFEAGEDTGVDDIVQCQLDICEDGKYFPAPTNRCGSGIQSSTGEVVNGSATGNRASKVASMAIKMERKDCMRAQGTPAGEGEGWQWTDCHFDLCTDMGLHLAKPMACANKLAYGYIETPAQDCANMGGTSPTSHAELEWANCYFDFCSGEFDAPFDFLSLMMYSPYAWSKNGLDLTLEPTGNHSDIITRMMGQRMGFSGLDIFHLGHMYDCFEKVKPFFDSKQVSHDIISGKFFEFNGTCQDVKPAETGFDVHGETGFMKHASCEMLAKDCQNATVGEQIRTACPVTCFVCMPDHGLTSGAQDSGACFDAVNTGIRFRDGPKATCKDLINYCNHTTIGPQVTEACKLSCGGCEAHIYAPFYDQFGNCEDEPVVAEPQFTIAGQTAACEEMDAYCQDHIDSYLVRRKCPKTCGVCGKGLPKKPDADKTTEIQIPGDNGGCNRRRRFGFCSTRRRRMA